MREESTKEGTIMSEWQRIKGKKGQQKRGGNREKKQLVKTLNEEEAALG